MIGDPNMKLFHKDKRKPCNLMHQPMHTVILAWTWVGRWFLFLFYFSFISISITYLEVYSTELGYRFEWYSQFSHCRWIELDGQTQILDGRRWFDTPLRKVHLLLLVCPWSTQTDTRNTMFTKKKEKKKRDRRGKTPPPISLRGSFIKLYTWLH